MIKTSELADQFTQFYSAVHPGREPYQWQLRLLDAVANSGQWPELIEAPTGAGKTSVIDVHIFLNAIADSLPHPIPRRIALVVGRRALVDSQYDYSVRLLHKLDPSAPRDKELPRPQILDTVWEGLATRAGKNPGTALSPGELLHLDYVRGGGSDVSRVGRWSIDPLATTLYFMTPDMFGSQLLFNGYAVARTARPIAAALLAFDTVAVIDEAHMNQQLVITARRVPEIDADAEERLPILPLQVVTSTATPTRRQSALGTTGSITVHEGDFAQDTALANRMNAAKSIGLEEVEGKLEDKKVIKRIIDLALDLESEGTTERPVGIMVNSPKTAVAISRALKNELGGDSEATVATIIGRMRPFDRKQYVLGEDGSIRIGGPEGTPARFVVATQTLEVGVDIDLEALITELAPANALIQRAGRVNRMGARNSGPIHVLVSPLSKRDERTGVYFTQDLERTRDWLADITVESPDFSPWRITQELETLKQTKATDALGATTRRRAFQRPEWADAEFWSITSEQTFASSAVTGAPANLDLWLSDGFDSTPEIAVAIRRLPRQEHLAIQYLQAAPIEAEEVMPVTLGTARTVLKEWLSAKTTDGHHPVRAFRIDADGNTEVLRPGSLNDRSVTPLRPSDTVVVDVYAPLFADKVMLWGGRDSLPDVSSGSRGTSAVITAVASLAEPRDKDRSTTAELAPFAIPTKEWQELARTFEPEATASWAEDYDGWDALMTWVDGLPNGVGEVLQEFVRTADDGTSVDVFTDNDELVLIVRKPDADVLDESEREVVTRRGPKEYVLLDDHQRDVAERARSIAERLGLPDWVQDTVYRAGLLHDEGKRDARFQSMLAVADWKARKSRTEQGDEWKDLAKSRFRSRAREQQFRSLNGLNAWRHEQLSAAVAWTVQADAAHADAVTRLVGTSHGYGRWSFADGVARLMPRADYLPEAPRINGAERAQVGDAAVVLFEEGEWEALMERTNRQFGLWGIAFLEALLRLADQQISAEGR
ncbi:type I-G CRISPR-associated helicase/endonuclease Cas3g [Haematomicrobium sanguinis]|uniref:type I-G CRISPR-associated helicase/endonuclease Cas3g n=1 Tax=Haematomicrobium sanguinis TaxID=479106 RepID=UPI000479F193|nr:hypothetical protein [Haematomicrobium sanguinis]